MQCRFSAPLTDEQLWAVLDGEANATIERHLKDCPVCAGQLMQLGRFAGAIKNTLHRYDCPTPDQLVDFHLREMTRGEGESVEAHLNICASCRNEVALFASLVNMDASVPVEQPPALSLPRLPRLREIVATLLPRPMTPALRGTETNKMTAQADGVTVFLEVEALPDGFTLTGQLLDADQEQWNDALVEVRCNGDLAQTVKLDDMGEFRCVGLPAGTAALRIVAENGRILTVPAIPLNP